MKRFRFNIASLLVVVLFVAVGFAALTEANDSWDSGVFTLTLTVLLVSVLLAVHRSEARRAFWIGFALMGSGYLALSLVPSIESRLMTTKGLAYLDSKVPGRTLSMTAFAIEAMDLATSSQSQVRHWDSTTGRLLGGWAGTTENFVRIGHSLIALLAGWFGGLLSRRLWQASRPSEKSTPGKPIYAKWRKPISRKCSAAIRVTIRGSVSSMAPYGSSSVTRSPGRSWSMFPKGAR